MFGETFKIYMKICKKVISYEFWLQIYRKIRGNIKICNSEFTFNYRKYHFVKSTPLIQLYFFVHVTIFIIKYKPFFKFTLMSLKTNIDILIININLVGANKGQNSLNSLNMSILFNTALF